ncbi:MAG: alpha/beta hydrolase [Lysobacteraceae bacterium]|jgi:predicted alpha/beta superfamily hydrolase|nr:MAG: alpha/beta hydrolase [Xanthomonadaceae bacterium]
MVKPGAIAWAALMLACAHGPARAEDSAPAHASFVLESRVLGETRRINVQTPPRYEVEGRVRYPVLYMPDGGVEEDFPHVAATIAAAIRAGDIEAMIVVGIENTERRRDMTGPTTVASDRTIAPRVGRSAAFRAFIADELMPEVERRYRTTARRAIVGESLAALFVLETLFVRPDLFDTYVALSPSLWWNDGALVKGAASRLDAWPRGRSRTLYLATASDDDIGGAALALRDVLRAHAPAGLRWQHEAWADLDHSNIYRRASPAVFRKVFANR